MERRGQALVKGSLRMIHQCQSPAVRRSELRGCSSQATALKTHDLRGGNQLGKVDHQRGQ